MKKVQYIFGALALITIPNWVQAQTQAKDTTLSRTVVVEQEYNPNIIDASKVNVLPKVMPPTVSKKTVEYDATLAPAGNIPATTMEAYTGAESQDKAKRGYARLGYGNYGNLDARALIKKYQKMLRWENWRLLDRKSTRLNSSHKVQSRMPSSA